MRIKREDFIKLLKKYSSKDFEKFCEIKDSILMSDSVIGSYNSIVGTVVGNGTETGTNVIANPSNSQVTYLDHTVSLSNWISLY